MDAPIFGYPKTLLEIAIGFTKASPYVRQFNHFLRFVTAIGHSEKRKFSSHKLIICGAYKSINF
ncbi:MAG: hypothetical protein ACP5G5_00545 [Thermoplasmata archaeon]